MDPQPQTSPQNSAQNQIIEISDKTYPVSTKWIFKSSAKSIVGSIISLIIGIFFLLFNFKLFIGLLVVGFIYFFFFLTFVPFRIFLNWLVKRNFHYKFDPEYLTIHQGILSKEQRNIPYAVLQNVLVNQDFFDKVFGLYSLSVENAAQGGTSSEQISFKAFGIFKSNDTKKQIGFSGNAVYIPGLSNEHAQFLKNYVLNLMKTNSSQRTGGL